MFAACDGPGGASGRTEPTLRDSSGITIADNPGPGYEAPEWTVGEAPVVVLGAGQTSPDDALYRVKGAVRLYDGRIVVANAGTHELRIYGPGGELLRAVGGEGEGPGEYRSLDGLVEAPGDTLIVQDMDLRRLTWLSSEGDRIRTVPIHVGEGDLRLMYMRLQGLWNDSLLFVAPPVWATFTHDEGSVRTDSLRVLLVGPDGVGGRDLVTVPGTETWFRSQDGLTTAMPVPFGAAVHYAMDAGRFFLGRSDRFEIAVYERGRAPGLLIRRPESPRPVTAQDRAAFREDYLAGAEHVASRRRVRERLLEELPVGEAYPAFAELAAGQEGRLWAREPAAPGADTAVWSIYGRSGLLEGRIRLPARFEIQEIGADFLLVLRRDELGVERIELWELRPPAPETPG